MTTAIEDQTPPVGESGWLQLAPELHLPLQALLETIAVLGRRGSGKTTTSVVMLEEIGRRAGIPFAVIDPLGVYFGLRSDAAGTGPGLPLVIFGGDHGDFPLIESSGTLLADLVVEQRLSAVFDLSALDTAAARRWVAAFTRRLFHRNRSPIHVVYDEADLWVPQTGLSGQRELHNALVDLVKRGRVRGIGVTLVSQRPASISKEVLTQAGILFALSTMGATDVDAIHRWLAQHTDAELADTVRRSLPGLPAGTAWVSSPRWLGTPRQVALRARDTFDSSATPEIGVVTAPITPLRPATVDLAALREQLAALEQQADAAAAEDPEKLLARIGDLERRLAQRDAPAVREVEVEVVSDDTVAQLRAMLEQLGGLVEHLSDALAKARRLAIPAAGTAPAGPRALPAHARCRDGDSGEPDRGAGAPVTSPPAGAVGSAQPSPARPESAPPVLEDSADARSAPLAGLPKAQRLILQALVQHPPYLTPQQLALLTGYRAGTSTIRNALAGLRRQGLVDEDSSVLAATTAGRAYIGDGVTPLPVGAELGRWWSGQLPRGPQLMLDALLAAHPESLTDAELAAAAGYDLAKSTFRNALGHLRTLALVHGGRRALVVDDALTS